MDFSTTTEQQALVEAVTRFCREHLNAVSPPREGEFPWDKWRLCCDQGIPGMPIGAEYGGLGYDCLTTAMVLEALGASCTDNGLVHALVTQILTALQIQAYGTDAQKARLLPAACRGELVLAQAMTEPDAGSSTGDIRTAAVAVDGGYRLNGAKVFISNAPIAGAILVYAVTSPGANFLQKLSCFVVDAGRSGLRKGRPMAKMGLESLQNGELFFDDCPLTDADLLGRKGQGSSMFSEAMTWERVLLFATHLGRIAHVFELSVEYAKGRTQFGSAIGKYQAIANKIVDMRVDLELGRLMLYKAAWLKDQGRMAAFEASMAKLFISERLRQAAIAGLQIHGGYGSRKEYPLEGILRDAMAGTIYSGTTEIQQNIIARFCGL
ncbi:MAG: acyl-CoA/acyl-ACP dehydrogenase [Gammaproteobacteria bacterium]|nr:acyl-CoA/acyl-ACP dehydrogenase [Gammaproteobacteria bacterium]